jgi:hypothetical protein
MILVRLDIDSKFAKEHIPVQDMRKFVSIIFSKIYIKVLLFLLIIYTDIISHIKVI